MLLESEKYGYSRLFIVWEKFMPNVLKIFQLNNKHWLTLRLTLREEDPFSKILSLDATSYKVSFNVHVKVPYK